VGVSLVSGIMPWAVPYTLVQYIHGGSIDRFEVRWVDYSLLLTLSLMIAGALGRQYKKWRGLKSVEQYRREQRGEQGEWFPEGVSELKRLARRQPPLEVYSESSSRQLITQLEPVSDLLVWKDQAKELVRLSSSSYAFDPENGWHDREHCWVGRNVNTGDLVFLYPYQGELIEAEVGRFLQYTDRIAQGDGNKIGEIIVATKDAITKLLNTWGNLTIRYETEDSLLDGLVDFKDYVNEIRRRALVNLLPDSDLTLNDVYVPSQLSLQDGSKYRGSVETYLNDWLGELSHRQLALLGEYGQGKSTAALMWAFHVIDNGPALPERIPILIELRGTSPRNLSTLQFLGAWAAQYNINAQALLRLHIAGRLVVIFEGFDEMALVGDAEMRLKHFRTLWEFAYPKARILITGRPNFFLDEEEMKAALGISKPVGDRPYCEALRLVPFNPEQIREALRAYKSTVRVQIYDLVKQNPRFLDLVSRPSLLHIVAVLWERERLFEKVDQLTSAFVMDLFIRHSYRRQGLKESDSPEFMALTTIEREYFMTGIATYMAAKRLPNQITGTQLGQVITDLIDSIPDTVSTASSAITSETTRPLRVRIHGTDYGVEHVKTDVRACGLLIDDPATPGSFRFGHKSFMEYLFAAVVAERIQSGEAEKARAVLKATGASIEDILSLPVAIDFLSEMLVGNKEAIGTEKEARELSTAKHLYRTILGENTGRFLIYRVSSFIEVLSSCVIRSKSPLIQAIVRMLLPMLFTLPFMIRILWHVQTNIITGIRENGDGRIWDWILVLGFVMSFLFIMPTPFVRRKLELWTRICEKIGIQNNLLHKVVGTSFILIIRDRPLDFHGYRERISSGEGDTHL
jgi:hypothetical protein